MVYSMLKFTHNLVRRNALMLITTPRIQPSSSLAKLKKLQADFQREDGTPVWLKRGIGDRILYSSTLIGCYIGIIMCLACYYDNAKPESWKKKE